MEMAEEREKKKKKKVSPLIRKELVRQQINFSRTLKKIEITAHLATMSLKRGRGL